jgi:hypothetical protein
MRLMLLLGLLLAGCTSHNTQSVDWENNYLDSRSMGGVGPSLPGDTGGNTLIINQGKVIVPQ